LALLKTIEPWVFGPASYLMTGLRSAGNMVRPGRPRPSCWMLMGRWPRTSPPGRTTLSTCSTKRSRWRLAFPVIDSGATQREGHDRIRSWPSRCVATCSSASVAGRRRSRRPWRRRLGCRCTVVLAVVRRAGLTLLTVQDHADQADTTLVDRVRRLPHGLDSGLVGVADEDRAVRVARDRQRVTGRQDWR